MKAQASYKLRGRVGDPLGVTWRFTEQGSGATLPAQAARFEVYGPHDEDPLLVFTEDDDPITLSGHTVSLQAQWGDLVDGKGDPLKATYRFKTYRYRLQVALAGRGLDTLFVDDLEIVEATSEPQGAAHEVDLTVDLGEHVVQVEVSPASAFGGDLALRELLLEGVWRADEAPFPLRFDRMSIPIR